MQDAEAGGRRDKVRGTVLGLAIGDALGYPGEFRSRQQILDAFGPEGVTDFVGIQDERWPERPYIVGKRHAPGTYTDDTQMSVALAEGLLDVGPNASLDDQMVAVGKRFVAWARSPENNRAPGGTCMTGCANLERGVFWRDANVADSKGCGSAMRVAPIGLLWPDDLEKVGEVARASSLLTHGHDAGVEGAAAAALLVALALRGATPAEMYREIMERCAPRSADFRRCLEKLPGAVEDPPALALSNAGLGEAWVAEEAVASALYCVWRHRDDYAAAVLCGANTDGDSDSIACIAGSIMGARLGASAIEARWRQEVENAAYLEELADRLYVASIAKDEPMRL